MPGRLDGLGLNVSDVGSSRDLNGFGAVSDVVEKLGGVVSDLFNES
jgi:hypothetical protein